MTNNRHDHDHDHDEDTPVAARPTERPRPASPPAGPSSEPEPDGNADGNVDAVLVLVDASDLLTAVPYLIGVPPAPGLIVVLAMVGETIEATVHADLATWDAPGAVGSLVRALSPVHPDAVTLIGYGDADTVEPRLTALRAGLPWRARDTIRVHRDRWWSLDETATPAEQPPAGRPVTHRPDLAAALLAEHAPAATAPPSPLTHDPAADDPAGDDDTRRLREQVRDRLTSVPARGGADRDLADRDVADLYRAVLVARLARRRARIRLDPDQAAVLLHAVSQLPVHDACAAWTGDASTLNLWLDLLAAAPTGWVTPVARLLALTAYQRGDTALAHHVLALGLRDDPGDSYTHAIAQWFLLGIPAAELTALLRARTGPAREPR